jgi:hypothetical protein
MLPPYRPRDNLASRRFALTAGFRTFAARRDVRVTAAMADRLVGAARQALPTPGAGVARQVLTADLALLDGLDAQVTAAEARD